MSTQHVGTANVKAPYAKPSLTEYGSLAQRTKIFGLPQGPTPDGFVIGNVIVTGSPTVSTIVTG